MSTGRRCYFSPQRLGKTLNAHLAGDCSPSGRAPWRTVARIAVQLIEALRYVHSKRHVYVDVNGDNVMTGEGAYYVWLIREDW